MTYISRNLLKLQVQVENKVCLSSRGKGFWEFRQMDLEKEEREYRNLPVLLKLDQVNLRSGSYHPIQLCK